MYEEPETFPADVLPRSWPARVERAETDARKRTFTALLQVAVAYALIEAALWTMPGRLEFAWIVLASAVILLSMLAGDPSFRQLGVAAPTLTAIGWTVLAGIACAATIPLFSMTMGYYSAPAHVLPFRQACQYAVWALVQQFILQSFFFSKLEAILGGRRAVVLTAMLFGVAHIPSPILTLCSFLGGLLFCEMFRRYRTIFPLGLVHAVLGLVIAASFSDAVLRHMRVGEGYLRFHH